MKPSGRRGLSARKLARLDALLAEEGLAPAGPAAPPPRPAGMPVPLSAGEEQLWFLQSLAPGDPAYNLPFRLRLDGGLTAADLRAAVPALAARHEALRTVYPEAGGRPVKAEVPVPPPPVVDLRALPPALRDAEAARLEREEAARPFDLRRGPLLRSFLLALGPGEFRLLLIVHHIAVDGASVGIAARELAALARGFAQGLPPGLAAPPAQAGDFAFWQRGWLEGEEASAQRAWWLERLRGLEPLELPADRPAPAVPTSRGALLPVRFDAGLVRRLRELGRAERATLFMTVLAALQALLARITGSRDVAVGSPVSGRSRPWLEEALGFFVNLVVLRTDLAGEPTFRELVHRVRDGALEAFARGDLPFEALVEELRPERRGGRNPLFEVALVVDEAAAVVPGLSEIPNGTTKFDLELELQSRPDGLAGRIWYARDRFDAPTVARLAGHFQELLAAAVADPDRRLADLPLLTAAERQQLAEWNDTGRTGGGAATLHGLFEEQAARTPDAEAVCWRDRSLTYAELERRAGRLAHHLRRLGVGPETRVAVRMPRSLDLIVSLLGILKAGAAYVPLDPAYPERRLELMREDAGAAVVLDGSELAEAEADRSLEGAACPALAVDPGNLAYLIYTSGSTGRPKAVAITHRSAVALVRWSEEVYEPEVLSGVLAATSICFDLSVFEIFVPLSRGGRIVLVDDALALASLQGAERVTLVNSVPSALTELVRLDALPASVRVVNLAGEPLHNALVQAIYGRGVERVYNLYGPSEDTTYSTFRRKAKGAARMPTIGRPLTGTRAHVLDRDGKPVPVGVAGELLLGGEGLARGYLGRPDLTAERFVPDPFAAEPGERLYRTGDLVRRLPDGSLFFLGRIDQQVKVRGFRIELGEIEAALAGHPEVREVVAIVRQEREGARLVAYVVPAAAPPAEELRRWLRERLPEPMVPSAFVHLDAVPLSPNGKVDRKALPAPGGQSTAESYPAPRTPVEEIVAGIWVGLLGLERVGADGHFFELGGHSLLATQVMSRLRGAFGVELPLHELFKAPTLAGLAARVEAARRSGEVSAAPPLAPVPRQGPLPLSFAQQRLWFIDQLEPGSPLYNLPVALRVEGPLDLGVLRCVLGEIVGRHEPLRTVFAVRDGTPVQVIRPASPCAVPVVDLSSLPESRREPLALILAGEESGRPFDLSRGPLLRSMLLRLSEEDHVVALTMHHIASDGWSIGILVREVVALYAAIAAGLPSPLSELPLQYADFAGWQRSWLQGEVLEREISYWRRQLAGLPPLLELPTDRPRPAVQSYRGASLPVHLPAALTRQVEALALQEGATLFMVLLAAFQALLARWSGQSDLAVGSPVAGRNWIEIEGLIGFFVNTLVLRGDLTGPPSFRALLGRARETALAAYLHQDVPFERLVEELAPERSLAYAPLFQVMFALQNAPVESLDIRDLRLRPVEGAGTTVKFDLRLNLEEHGGEIGGEIGYATDLFDATTIDRLIEHFERLLTAAVAAPDVPIPALPLLDGAERWQILWEWNDTQVQGLAEGCLHQDVAAQAARTPEAVAVELGDERWTYRRLVGSSRRLARHLRRQGVGPDVVVGLCAERSPEMVAGMLAVLEAGGAYLPLDPSYPVERLAFQLEDSGARILLIQEHLLERVPATGRHVVPLDARWDAGEEAGEGIGVEVSPDHLAYVIYTSGSTGRPKGVMVPHRGAVNRLRWAQQVHQLGDRDAVLQKAPFGFDFSVWECFAPLVAGARLVLAEPGRQGDARYLVRTLREHRVTFVHFVPSMLAAFLGEEDVETCSSLRQCFTGGEALTPELRDRALGRLRVQLDNQYGPTETSIDSTRWVCAPGREPHRVPIGRPIANNRLYVVDPELRAMPIGVAGELLIGGEGVARGYLGQPALTAERFVPDPFGMVSGGRLYRTGDLVRYLPGGDVEFFGRLDHQVKVRGFRIELEEIEAALRKHPSVRESAVAVRRRGGDPALVAYAVPSDGGSFSPAAFRLFLRERLPDYMVPEVYVPLEALPLSPNGKVDRKALPAPDLALRTEEAGAPRTQLEEVVAAVWAEVLGLERVGVHDDFFVLGGHSLRATQVIARLREALGVELPVRAVFEARTVAELALHAGSARMKETAVPPLRPFPRDGAPPLSFAQSRLWFLDQLAPGAATYNVPLALDLRGPLDVPALAGALGAIVARHESLRTTFPRQGGAPVQAIQAAAAAELPCVDLGALPEPAGAAEAERLAGAAARAPFDLAAGPLLRGLLLRRGAGRHELVLALHHIVADGWSLRVLLGELGELYAGAREGRPARLPELPVQYGDYALWQREMLRGEVLERQLAFWRPRLLGVPPLDLATDRPRPPEQSSRGAERARPLPSGLADALEALGRREGVSLFMILLASLRALLWRASGQRDFAVGTPVANRQRTEVEGLIGFFANTLVLRGEVTGDSSFRALLAAAREEVLAAHDHQDVPFETLVEELQPARDLGRSPLFQVLLTLGADGEALHLDGLEATVRPLDTGTAKFDLAFAFGESRGVRMAGIEYCTDLFEAPTVERLLGHWLMLLAGATAAPESAVSALPLLAPQERQQILAEWNDTGRCGGEAATIHGLFAAQAARTPDAEALAWGNEALGYRELDLRSNRLAHRLRRLGAGPEARVAVLLPRSTDLIVALLAILKTGAAYVPLDPAYPERRLEMMLADAGAVLLLTTAALAERVPAGGCTVLRLDEERAALTTESAEGLAVTVWPENLAYLIFTSGSTGRPKAVAITHRSATGLLRWARGVYPPETLAGVLAATSVCFDLSVFEIFVPLAWGGRIVLVDDALALASLPRSERVTLVNSVPSALSALVRQDALPSSLRVVNLAGEALHNTLVQSIYARGVERVYNLYGPSEDTTYSTYRLKQQGAGWAPTIGRPLPGTRAYVLDGAGDPVPVGVPGELFLAGEGLARGYLGRPELTAGRFVPDPFAAEPGGRLYRTGDLVRWLPAGNLAFLGRIDHQVKVRGFRIELGEIEQALGEHPAVRQAAVAVRCEGEDAVLVAWVAPASEVPPAPELRRWLRERLPEPMVPSAFVPLEALPLSPNGKIDRRALPAPVRTAAEAPAQRPASGLEQRIAGFWKEVLGVAEVGLHDNFFDLGGHSLLLFRLQGRLQCGLGLDVPMVDLFRCPTVAALAAHLGGSAPPQPAPARAALPGGRCDVAVIGLAGRFPGARNPEELWDNLCRGVEAITFFGAPRQGTVPGQLHVPARGVLADADLFDAGFFGIRPREAELLDPQHRLFLECAWETLESAGYDPGRHAGSIGVWTGVGRSTYYLSRIHDGPGADDPSAQFGNDSDYLPTRLSYKLGLRGPSLAVQTACSSSLVAVHLACRSLAQGECDMALAGGARIVVPQEAGYIYEEGGIYSPDGHCRAFDAGTRGVVPGNGVGVVLLKRLTDALADGDPVLAVIRGSAVNNDGSDKVGYTAPSVDGQARVIAAAHAAAEVSAADIGFVEAHGTGTALGDPIEVAALKQAFGAGRPGFCALGAIKANVGHLDAAAGVAGLIKAVLALRHRQIPPTLHFRQPNPGLGLEGSPFFVNPSLLPWETAGPRRAGVSSFGIGGTNAHVILEEAPAAEPPGPARSGQALVVSARSAAALAQAAANLVDHLERHPEDGLADIAWTLQVGRRAFPHRLAVVAAGVEEASAKLRTAAPARTIPDVSVAFLFPGQGAQRAGMARDLYREEPVVRAEIDRGCDLLRDRLGIDLRELLDPPAGRGEEAARRLERTELTQPALFVVEHALARLWMSWGIRPAACLGHSVGEYVAACLAGVFSFEDALLLVAERGRLMGELPPGAMLAVPLPEAEARSRLDAGLSLAAVNGATACVVAGAPEAVEALRERLLAGGVEAKRLRVSHAFHSAMMDPVLARFAAAAARVERRPPSLPWVSNVSGTWIRSDEAVDPAYWARHLRATVRFHEGLGTLLAEPGRVLLEVGPGATLARFARRHPAAAGRPVYGGADPRELLEALGGLWTAGVEPDWAAVHAGERRRRVALPTYPFERQRYWIEAPPRNPLAGLEGRAVVLLAVPAGSPEVVPDGWEARRLEGPLSPEIAAALGDPGAAGGEASILILRPAAPMETPVGAAAPAAAGPAIADLAAADAPRDEIETTVASLWQESFGIARIGIHDGFFHLGGDSLLATQIVSRLRGALGREISLSAFLEAGTIARLAEVCRTAPAAPGADAGLLLADLENRSIEELEALLAAQASNHMMHDGGL